MNMRILPLSSLLLVAGFAQCTVENSQQKEIYADCLQWIELREQFNNSPEGRDFNHASSEFYKANTNLMTIKEECNRLGNGETSNELIESFFAVVKAKNNFMQQAEKIEHLELCKSAAELEKKYQ
jgi:hypothetical protein